MRRVLAWVVAAIASVGMSAGSCDVGNARPNPAAQPEAPAADVGPNNTPTNVHLKVTWIGERSGWVTVYLNGKAMPQEKAPKPHKFGGSSFYTGAWERNYPIASFERIGVSWSPDVSGMPAQCSIWHEGVVVDNQGVNSGPCAANWTRS